MTALQTPEDTDTQRHADQVAPRLFPANLDGRRSRLARASIETFGVTGHGLVEDARTPVADGNADPTTSV